MQTEEHFLSVCASISNPALLLQSFQSHTEWLPDTHASELCCVPLQRRNEVVRLGMLESAHVSPMPFLTLHMQKVGLPVSY